MANIDFIEVGLTQFIDFTVKSSTARVTHVRKIKNQEDYQPAFDYWKQLREEIINAHQNELSLDGLNYLIEQVDAKKQKNYAEAISRYQKFFRKKQVQWFDPGKSFWVFKDLHIRSSADLGLNINGEPYLVKLYFKGKTEKVDKRNTRIALALMRASRNTLQLRKIKPAVLNIQKATLYPFTEKLTNDMKLALEADADNFIFLWNNL